MVHSPGEGALPFIPGEWALPGHLPLHLPSPVRVQEKLHHLLDEGFVQVVLKASIRPGMGGI